MASPEQRCTDIDGESGGLCVCSEPLNASTLTQSGDYFQPDDSGTKRCTVSGSGPSDYGIFRTSAVVASNDATALAALPSGHSVSNFIRPGQNDHGGSFDVGHGVAVSATYVRLAARFYRYFTPDYLFKGEGSCQNSKWTEHDNNNRFDYDDGGGNGNFHLYNFLAADGWSPGADCCGGGPHDDLHFRIPPSDMRSKWWRYEIVMTARAGSPLRIILYGQNITDGDPETDIIDTDDSSQAQHTPASLMSKIVMNGHRTSGEVCTGWTGISHYLMAGWDTDAGQRIGAASEVEGGGGGGIGIPKARHHYGMLDS